MIPWAPANGASLVYVAAKRGWPFITAGVATVALAPNGIYYSGSLSDAAALLRRLV